MNPLKIDPSRTTMLRERLGVLLCRQLELYRVAVLSQLEVPTANAWSPDGFGVLLQWVKDKAVQLLITPGKRILQYLLGEGVKKGVVRAAQQVAVARRAPQPTPETVKVQVTTVLSAPTPQQRVQLIMQRSLADLEGLSGATVTGISKLLAEGMAGGHNPKKVGAAISKQLGVSKKRAVTIARTEMIRAHAEGQLIAFEQMGIKSVGVLAEWHTANDFKVCSECAGMNKVKLTIEQARSRIPAHPNCRCAWLPYIPEVQRVAAV